MRTIPLHGKLAAGRVALVDDADCEAIARYTWRVWEYPRPSGRTSGPYAITAFPRADGKQRSVGMHVMLTGWPRTDHADHNGLNNQRHNLRPATVAQNAWNARSSGGASQYKGVWFYKDCQKWAASIRYDGRRRYLGRYPTEVEAALAYDAAARDYFGEFAYLNFP